MQPIQRDWSHLRPLPWTEGPVRSRTIRGIVLHHTATSVVPTPRYEGSWTYCIDADGTVYQDVPEDHIAHHVARTDRWRPWWVEDSPLPVSAANWSSLGIELVYAPQDREEPTVAQYAALQALLADIYARRGGVPVVGHGALQVDKWPTEPHGLDWERAGFGPRESDGRWWLGTGTGGDGMAELTDGDRAALATLQEFGWDAGSIITAIEEIGALQAALHKCDERIQQGIAIGAELIRGRMGSGERKSYGRKLLAWREGD